MELALPLLWSANFWPLLCLEDGSFIHNVVNIINLPSDKFNVSCKSGGRIFGTKDLKHRVLALNLEFKTE